jgi:glycine/D-amino acid oxidase-like deaminating enzyme
VALAETAAGDLAGLGDVLAGISAVLGRLDVDCALSLPGAWELGRAGGIPGSPISWADSGSLRVVQEVPGGDVDPGMLVSGLARSADRLGALVLENTGVENISFEEPLLLEVSGKQVRAEHVLVATNALSLELNGLIGRAVPAFTLAVATAPLSPAQLHELGLAARKPFYTVDLPYLWGRLTTHDGAVFGSGLVYVDDWREFAALDIGAGEPAKLIARLERRVRRLHPALRSVEFTHRWGGPILIGDEWVPVFHRHPRSARVLVLGAYSGHGVALSVYLGCWAAEVMLGNKQLPQWNAP